MNITNYHQKEEKKKLREKILATSESMHTITDMEHI